MENILLIDGALGIHIPRLFNEKYKSSLDNRSDFDMDNLKDPDNDGYWAAWEEVVDRGILTIEGKKYTLAENGDLWAVPVTEKNAV